MSKSEVVINGIKYVDEQKVIKLSNLHHEEFSELEGEHYTMILESGLEIERLQNIIKELRKEIEGLKKKAGEQ
jgi:hypothetical protein